MRHIYKQTLMNKRNLSKIQKEALRLLEKHKHDNPSYVYYWRDNRYYLIGDGIKSLAYNISFTSKTIRSLEERKLIKHVFGRGYVLS